MIKLGNFTWEAALLKIAKHYGYKEQLGQLQEECGELVAAAHKQVKKENGEWLINDNFVEEVADVEIMIEQLKLLFKIKEPVEGIKAAKIRRQLDRIHNEEVEIAARKVTELYTLMDIALSRKESKNAKV